MSEELLIRHCSPTLAGLKTGNIFTMSYSTIEDIRKEVRSLNKIFLPKGLRVIPLRFENNRVMVYVYRPNKLKQDLKNENVCWILENNGYPSSNPSRCIMQLIKKLKANSDFPHEIGLFLGYPPEDVQGFIENKAEHYKFTGHWKVYGDEKKARKLFFQYKKCTAIYTEQWQSGKSIERLAVAV